MAKKPISVSVDEEVYKLIVQQAKSRSLSPYAFAGDLLTQAALNTERFAADQLLTPHIRLAVSQELNRMSEQIIEMLVRIYMEGGTSRRLTQVLLSASGDLEPEAVSKAAQMAWDKTYTEMDESLAGLTGWRAKVTANQLLKIDEE